MQLRLFYQELSISFALGIFTTISERNKYHVFTVVFFYYDGLCLYDGLCILLCRYPSTLLKRQFWIAACSTHPVAHENVMKQVLKLCKPAYEQLKKLDPVVWTKAHISTIPKADNIMNNMSEFFNSWIINERYLHFSITYLASFTHVLIFIATC